jgi:hypothetical protein
MSKQISRNIAAICMAPKRARILKDEIGSTTSDSSLLFFL